ncbi:MAG: NADH:flavin oxidoreductase [Bacillota bacterium]|nr:NADH:flavin oxidoreductase [Bacillota bacterium]
MTYEVLKPFRLGKVTLKNRVIFPPITTGYGSKLGQVTPELIAYYKPIAQGGAGAIIVEAAVVNPQGRLSFNSIGIWDNPMVDGLSRLAESIKSQGTAAFLQLAHAGPRSMLASKEEQSMSVSEVPFIKSRKPVKMTSANIKGLVEDFVEAAARAQKAGFDGIEIHAAHFYLLSCFLSPVMNNRDDEYGGDAAGRSRVVTEIISGIREKVGIDYPIICRIHGQEMGESGIDIKEAIAIGKLLEVAGATALHISAYYLPVTGMEKYLAVPGTPIPGDKDEPGLFAPLAGEFKKNVNIPVIAVGKINSLQLAEQLVTEKKCDLVAIGRPLVADPEFINKVYKGQEMDQCLYCRACINALAAGKSMVCRVNKRLQHSS